MTDSVAGHTFINGRCTCGQHWLNIRNVTPGDIDKEGIAHVGRMNAVEYGQIEQKRDRENEAIAAASGWDRKKTPPPEIEQSVCGLVAELEMTLDRCRSDQLDALEAELQRSYEVNKRAVYPWMEQVDELFRQHSIAAEAELQRADEPTAEVSAAHQYEVGLSIDW